MRDADHQYFFRTLAVASRIFFWGSIIKDFFLGVGGPKLWLNAYLGRIFLFIESIHIYMFVRTEQKFPDWPSGEISDGPRDAFRVCSVFAEKMQRFFFAFFLASFFRVVVCCIRRCGHFILMGRYWSIIIRIALWFLASDWYKKH